MLILEGLQTLTEERMILLNMPAIFSTICLGYVLVNGYNLYLFISIEKQNQTYHYFRKS